MKFGALPLGEAEGSILGHSVSIGGRRLRKGHRLSSEDLAAFAAAGRDSVIAARLEPGDVPEDAAAERIARAAAGRGVVLQAAFTGRCNLYAERRGLAVLDAARVEQLNLVDESATIATVQPYELVEPRQMLATVKVIPFSAPEAVVRRCVAVAADAGPLVQVAALAEHAVGLVMTRLPETKQSVLDKTRSSVSDRLTALGSRLAAAVVCSHDEADIAAAVRRLHAEGCAPILVFGASAIVDRRDVVPAGIVAAGGDIEHFGMPVDPGNLLLLARLGPVPVIGVPGCARSPKVNGFDWVLQRLLAGIQVRREDIMRMGPGGLLKEIVSRPQPREGGGAEPPAGPRAPQIAAVVLAAGQSRRMGRNKLLAPVDGRPMFLHAVDAALASQARPVVVVTGHQAAGVESALAGRPVTLVHNPQFADGLSTSLRCGLAAVPPGCDGAVVCLGDMPRLKASHIDRLIAAFNPVEGRSICVPVAGGGKRGNPVLWAARFFPEMRGVAGDVGARHLIGEHAEQVCEVPIDDDGVLLDVDTPESLAALQLSTG